MLLNDVHSRLNPTEIRTLSRPRTAEEVSAIVREAARRGERVAVAGRRHAMGGQQFATAGNVIDLTGMNRLVALDAERGLAEIEAGATWPDLIAALERIQPEERRWSIVQKQTGADDLSLGGALAANVHGRGLALKPLIGDIEAFRLIDAEGRLRHCSRSENAELFGLAIGGYGLFGVITSLTLRLRRRQQVERVVVRATADHAIALLEAQARDGFLYGDFQFSTDAGSPGFLPDGILSCYRPLPEPREIPPDQRRLGERDWLDLLYLAHADRARAYELYCDYYLSTSGQVYWSDTHQLGTYVPDYHAHIDARIGAKVPGSLMISEVYVPRDRLAAYLSRTADDFRRDAVPLVYGTVRLIERDDESFLPWAREAYACIVFNLRVEHCDSGIAQARRWFRRLIDGALHEGGSFYLTYHRWATAEQVRLAYPEFAEFLAAKRRYDPAELFASDWYRHYAAHFERRAAA